MTVHSLTLQPRETGTATGKETGRQTDRETVGQTARRFIELAKQCLAAKPKLACKNCEYTRDARIARTVGARYNASLIARAVQGEKSAPIN